MHQSSIKELFHPGRGACQVFPGTHLPGRLPCYVFGIGLLTQTTNQGVGRSLIISPARLSQVPNTQWVLPGGWENRFGRNFISPTRLSPQSTQTPPNISTPTTNSSQLTQLHRSNDKMDHECAPVQIQSNLFFWDRLSPMSHNSRPGIQGLDDYFSFKFPYNRHNSNNLRNWHN